VKWIALALIAACGGTPPKPAAVVLPAAKPGHVRTMAERKADACRQAHLVPPVVAKLADTVVQPTAVVRNVEVRDAAGALVEVPIEALAPLRLGEAFTPEAAREVGRRLWKSGKLDDVAVDVSGETVIFRVSLKRSVAEVFTVGADASALHLQTGTAYDPVAIVSNGQSFIKDQVGRGYLDASLALSSAFAGADAKDGVDVCVRYESGALITIDKLDVRGSAHVTPLLAMLAQMDDRNVHGAVPDEDHLERDALLVQAWLYDHGLVASTVSRKSERHDDSVVVVFDVTDGAVYRYAGIELKGDLLAPKADYAKVITAKKGDVFDRSAMLKVVEDIRTINRSHGYGEDVTVEPETTLDAAKATIDIVIRIKAPPRATPSQFAIVELAPGHGRAAKSGDLATLEYVGKLTNGTVFDTSKGRGPFQFRLGAGTVIAGFDRGVDGMKVGGKRRVTIPPDMGYGARGAPPSIPPYSTLIFEIELTALQ
jgi:FKBP-type peptidyl-prolyl cis-trans isomerase